MKSKKITHLYFQFGRLAPCSHPEPSDIARALEMAGLIIVHGDRYVETMKMKSIQVLDEYIREVLKEL